MDLTDNIPLGYSRWTGVDWQYNGSFDAIVKLRDELDEMLQRIRSERQIRPLVFKCPNCGYIGEGAEPHVSVRAMILSLIRFGIAAVEPTYMIEKDWAAYRKQQGPGGRREMAASGLYSGQALVTPSTCSE